jgi:ferric-dicitrate binding protein FerR (iron transport regulator)
MERFEELQQLWRSQPQPEPQAVVAESRGMAAALRRFWRRQYVFSGIKLVVIIGLGAFLLSRLGVSVLTVLGVGLLLGGMINPMVSDWRSQSAIARLDFTRSSVGFLDATLERLRDPNAAFRRAGWTGIAMVAAGANLIFAARWTTGTLGSIIASHTAVTLVPFAAFAFGLKVRAKRYAMEYKPLMERLEAMKAALEEHAR